LTGRQLDIITIASEMVPFAKTGGLADVSGSLAKKYRQLGHNSYAILPAYKDIGKGKAVSTGISLDIQIGQNTEKANILKSEVVPGVTTYLIDHPYFSLRNGLYGSSDGDFPDNAARFILFSKASLELIISLGLAPDIIHCHDWQTGLIPAYLRNGYIGHSNFTKTKSVFTIHNLAYQGLFPPETMLAAGLPWSFFHIDGLEFYGKMNFLKGGLTFSDHITTVSPTYAKEILTPEFGCGLHGLLTVLQHKLTGIINGIDYTEWDPKTDNILPIKYQATEIEGKQTAKRLLCKRLSLPYQPDRPMMGIVSRLAAQKGLDIISEALPRFFELDLGLAVLGTGDIAYHDMLSAKQVEYRERFGLKLDFDNELAHLIYAGSDIFLMPSRYEPCGLGQMIALRYGSIPVVRNTGGLADTIFDLNHDSAKGNGFVFSEYSSSAFLDALTRALESYHDRDKWHKLISNAMSYDYSWESSADKYLELFFKLLER
jgi:starch synthase